MKLSGWAFAVGLLFAGGATGCVVSGLLTRGAFQAGFKLGTAHADSILHPVGGICQRADVPTPAFPVKGTK